MCAHVYVYGPIRVLYEVAIGPALNSYSVGLTQSRVGLRLGLGKSLFPVSRAKDQRLPAGPIATAYNISDMKQLKLKLAIRCTLFTTLLVLVYFSHMQSRSQTSRSFPDHVKISQLYFCDLCTLAKNMKIPPTRKFPAIWYILNPLPTNDVIPRH